MCVSCDAVSWSKPHHCEHLLSCYDHFQYMKCLGITDPLFCIVSPTGTFPLDSFLLVVVGMVGVRARVFLFGVRQNKAIRSFLEGSSFYFLTVDIAVSWVFVPHKILRLSCSFHVFSTCILGSLILGRYSLC